MSKLAIVHFQPLELYPPIQNLIHFIRPRSEGNEIDVYTTATCKKTVQFKTDAAGTIIKRLAKSGNQLPGLSRYYNYLLFYVGCLYNLIRLKPKKILYFETLSSFPVYIYKRYFNSKTEVFIHYHEYTATEEYNTGMKLAKLFHKQEKKLYPKASWVSHTNIYRMQKFVADLQLVTINNQQVLPNYPPKSWETKPKLIINMPVKIIYVGALSLDTMYVKEFAVWVKQQNGKVVWDIFSTNITGAAMSYLDSLASSWINIKSGVPYHELPAIIKKYAVGVVLYNGHIANYINNAPNKLFEYLASGLDVWFPTVMKGSLPYITKDSFPKVIAVDFTALPQFNLANTIDRNGFSCKPTAFFCEDALEDITKQFLKND